MALSSSFAPYFANLRFKLLVAPLLTLLAVFSLIGVLISQRVDLALLANEDARISLSAQILGELYTGQQESAKNILKAVVVQPEMAEGYFVAKTEDNLTPLTNLLKRGMEQAKAQIGVIVKKDGTPLLNTAAGKSDPLPHLRKFLQPILQHAAISDPQHQLDEILFTTLYVADGHLYWATVGPLLDVEDIIGMVALIRPIDISFVQELRTDMERRYFGGISYAEVSLALADRLLVSSLPGLALPRTLVKGQKNGFDLTVQERPFRHLFLPLEKTEGLFLGLSYDVSENAGIRSTIQGILVAIVAAAMTLVIAIILFNTNRIIRAIGLLVEYAQRIALGDLTQRVTASSNDEVGHLFVAVNRMARSLGKTIRTVSLQSDTVEMCVTELAAIKGQLARDSDNTFSQVQDAVQENDRLHDQITDIRQAVARASTNIETISSHAERLSNEINTIAKAADLTSGNVSTVAAAARRMNDNLQEVNNTLTQVKVAADEVGSAVQEMGLSFTEVRQRCEEGAKESVAAGDQARNSYDIMHRLETSAQEIGQVVQTIGDIADQTRILSLNAGIEAAMAGVAGKQFAVVARAVKELARQTAAATQQIAKGIGEIQTNSRLAAAANQEIGAMIITMGQVVQGITQAVDKQTGITGEITQAIAGVNQSVTGVSRSTQALGEASREVAMAAARADEETNAISLATGQVALAGVEMRKQGDHARLFIHSILNSAEKTSRSSDLVQEKMQHAFQLVRYMQGSVAHFEKLTGVVQGTSQALRTAQSGLEVEPAQFSVQEEKKYLLSWIGKLEQVLQGRMQLTADEVMESQQCLFGRWYHSQGKELFSHLPQFLELGQLHQQAHELLRESLTLFNRGETAQAEKTMQQINLLRDRFFVLLDGFYQENAATT